MEINTFVRSDHRLGMVVMMPRGLGPLCKNHGLQLLCLFMVMDCLAIILLVFVHSSSGTINGSYCMHVLLGLLHCSDLLLGVNDC